MSEVEIREARVADLPVVMGFVRKLAEYEKLSSEMVADETQMGRWLFGEQPAAEVMLAFVNGRAAGFALFFRTFSTFLGRPGLYLEDLFVEVAERGHGIGKALLQRLAQVAVEREYGRLEWAVLDWNAPAIGFYKRLGARPLDDWTTYRLTGDALTGLARGATL